MQGGNEECISNSFQRPEWFIPLGKTSHRWDDNIKIDKEIYEY
jgi:hypothetical protein